MDRPTTRGGGWITETGWKEAALKLPDDGSLPEDDFETDPASLVALIVGPTAADELTSVLHERAWDVRHCPGPRQRLCPLLNDGRCALRERSDVAVIYMEAGHWVDPAPAIELILCGAHSSSPVAALIAGDVAVLEPLGPTPVVTEVAGPEDVANTIEQQHRRAIDD